MKKYFSLRYKLTVIFIITILIPFLIMAIILPNYFKNLINHETETLTSGAMNSLSRNIQTYLDDLDRLTSLPYVNDELIQALKIKANNNYTNATEYTKLMTNRALNGALPNYLISTRHDILSTLILTFNGEAYLSSKLTTSDLVPKFPFTIQDWYRKTIEADGKAAFISPHAQNYLTGDKANQVFSVGRLIKDPDSRQNLAVILADADNNLLKQITDDVSFSVRSMVAIIDEDNRVLYSNHALTVSMLAQIADKKAEVLDGKEAYVTLVKKIEPAHWSIVVMLSQSEISAKTRWIFISSVILSIGGLIVTFLIFLYFTRWIVNPFRQMNDVMKSVRNGNLQVQFIPNGNDEIAQLGESLNKTIIQLDEMITKEYKAVLSMRNAEYRALQSQIQPHFLYNVLTGFIGLNRNAEKGKLEAAIFALSSMLRYILAENQESTLEDEMTFLKSYGLLQQIRFQERLTLDIDYERSLSSFRIPKLLIQPLLENAIIHGVEPCNRPCLVKVSATIYCVDDVEMLLIEVIDNGVGFEEDIQEDRPHIGNINVKTRLQIAYPEAEFTLVSRSGIGTVVSLYIPLNGVTL
jgi:two-component system sensor histidine kinase YesM